MSSMYSMHSSFHDQQMHHIMSHPLSAWIIYSVAIVLDLIQTEFLTLKFNSDP